MKAERLESMLERAERLNRRTGELRAEHRILQHQPANLEAHLHHRRALGEHRAELAAFSEHLRRLRQENAVFHRMHKARQLRRRIEGLTATAYLWRAEPQPAQ